MLKPYRIEVFDRDLNFVDYAVTSSLPLEYDYLTLETVSVQVKSIFAERGNFVHVTDFDGNTVLDGIVKLLRADKHTVTVDIDPLLSLFNTQVLVAPQTQYIEDWLEGMITDKYISNPDTVQNINMTITCSSSTEATIAVDDEVSNLWEICTAAFQQYGITVTAFIDFINKGIDVTIGVIPSVRVIEADLDNVLESNFVFEDTDGYNLMTFWLEDLSAKYSAYLDTSGTVQLVSGDPPATDRVLPVYETIELVDSFDTDKMLEEANKELLPSNYNNLIELTFDEDDGLVKPLTFIIGETVQVIRHGTVYTTLLSGYAREDGTVRLVCGVIRMELTKKLILERRRFK